MADRLRNMARNALENMRPAGGGPQSDENIGALEDRVNRRLTRYTTGYKYGDAADAGRGVKVQPPMFGIEVPNFNSSADASRRLSRRPKQRGGADAQEEQGKRDMGGRPVTPQTTGPGTGLERMEGRSLGNVRVGQMAGEELGAARAPQASGRFPSAGRESGQLAGRYPGAIESSATTGAIGRGPKPLGMGTPRSQQPRRGMSQFAVRDIRNDINGI